MIIRSQKTCLWTEHHTWRGGQMKGTKKKQNRVLTIHACGQALMPHVLIIIFYLIMSYYGA